MVGELAALVGKELCMRRSKSMFVAAVLGLVLGVPLALDGWEGVRQVVAFLEEQSPRLLGSILVGLSLAVLVRQARSGSAAPAHPPGGPHPTVPPPQEPGAIPRPESPTA
jgi:hypothetical protein